MDRNYCSPGNKYWSEEYINDPLTGPVPNDECGPGSSFITPDGRARRITVKNTKPATTTKNLNSGTQQTQSNNPALTQSSSKSNNDKPLPRLPGDSPSYRERRPGLSPSHPTSPPSFGLSRKNTNEGRESQESPFLSRVASVASRTRNIIAGNNNSGRYPPVARSGLTRSKTVHTIQAVETSWNQGTIITRSNSVATTGDSTKEWAIPSTRPARGARRLSESLHRAKTVITATPRPQNPNRDNITLARSASARSTTNQRTPSRGYSFVSSPVASPPTSPESPKRYQLEDRPMAASPVSSNNPFRAHMEEDKGKSNLPKRSGSLSARFPGDMSHRPLDIIKQQHRAADRNPYNYTKKHRHVRQPSDPIDLLDKTGVVDVPFHHDGPYDPTLADRNMHTKYPPIEAVRESNEEALKATPRENIQDSLTKHVPLQGTANIPPGMRDMAGRTMEYEEGADLMREPSAGGGAYKRYDFLTYQDGDLKGKSEPSYSYEKDLKERKHAGYDENGSTVMYEMQPGVNRTTSPRDANKEYGHVSQRSVSNADQNTGPASPTARVTGIEGSDSSNSGVARRNTTGKSKLDGLKRRIGSIRRKNKGDDDDYI